MYILFVLVCFPYSVISQTYLEADFENEMPANWEEINVSNGGSWEFQDGGRTINGENHPESAYEGNLNALFSYMEQRVTKLVTPTVDLSEAVKAELQFGHAMLPWGPDIDELRVYYKESADSSWKILKTYTSETNDWIERTIQLPDTTYTSDYKVAFEATAKGGAGVCIDHVQIIETGIIPKRLESIHYQQASREFVPSGSENNAIIRLDLQVSGNSGDLYLDSLAVNSLNTDDGVISDSGVKLYATEDTLFSKNTLIGQPTDFISGNAIFDNLGYALPYGVTSLWVTYDIESEIDHEAHTYRLDAKINQNALKINTQRLPYSDKSPSGYRLLYESIIYENFEGTTAWDLSGEFQIGVPQGKGSEGSYGWYSADPDSNAVSGIQVLGTDLEGLNASPGNYEADLSENAYYAVSPPINCSNYQNVAMNYYRWLNIESLDVAAIDLIISQQDTIRIWNNDKSYNEDEWVSKRINISQWADRESEIKLAFAIGPTNDNAEYGGWNIDDFSITGDYVASDVGVVDLMSPMEGCNLSGDEPVMVVVKNYGAETIADPIPMAYSLDDGKTMVYDTIEQSIAAGDSLTFTFGTKADFSVPGSYRVLAETNYSIDENTRNDQFTKKVFSYPIEPLPYTQSFEQNDGFWQALGNKSWEHGVPRGDNIDAAATGDKVWMTKLDEPYSVQDSSFIESPCFDLSTASQPVFEMAIAGNVEEGADGMKMQYSIDGEIWHSVDSASAFGWEWYNNSVDALGAPGWSRSSAGWTTVRKLLPNQVTNYSIVKFRLLFQSDGYASGDDGYAIDDISIYDAPIDVGVKEILQPVTDCELSEAENVQLAIKNYGLRPIDTTEAISVQVDLNTSASITDTFYLDQPLGVDETVNYTLSKTLDFSEAGDYPLTAYTRVEDDPDFYGNSSNDTAQTVVSVIGMPNFDLGPSIGTEQADTLVLDAGEGYSSYNWHDGGPANRFYDISSDGTYSVTVTNAEGCTATDSILILPSNTDIGIVKTTGLASACEYPEPQTVKVFIKNFGDHNKVAGEKLPLGYSVNKETFVNDTLILENTIYPGDTAYFDFTAVDLSESKFYDMQFYTQYEGDIDLSNDSTSTSIEVYGHPVVDLGPDTIYTQQADTIVLNAGGNHASYQWQDNSTDSTFNIASKANALYHVTVEDGHGCNSASDSVKIIADDLSLAALLYPQSSCSLGEVEYPEVAVKNTTQNTYPQNTSIYLGYSMNGSGFQKDTVLLSGELNPGDSIMHQFNSAVDMSDTGVYAMKMFVHYPPDINHDNDTLNSSVQVYGYPRVDIGPDTMYTTHPDTISLDAGSDFKDWEWQDGSTDSIYQVSAMQSGLYTVTVTAFHGCGTASDSVLIVSNDLSINELVAPINDCSHSSTEEVTVKVLNSGNDTLAAGYEIPIGFSQEGATLALDTIVLAENFLPQETIEYTFSETIDLTKANVSNVSAFIDMVDVNAYNDTLNKEIISFGYPEISLGADTIFTTQADTLEFTVDNGYTSYEWQDGSMNDTFQVNNPASQEYRVTVGDINGCSTSDSVFVSTYDLGVTDIIQPQSACELSSEEEVEVMIKNFGADTLLTGRAIVLLYELEGSVISEEAFTLQDTLFPDSTLEVAYSQPADFSENSSYDLQAYSSWYLDADRSNDSVQSIIEVYGTTVNLGADTAVESPTYEIDAGAGYASYEWQDGSTGQTFTAEVDDGFDYYEVTVTNDMGCTAKDTIYVYFDVTPDLSLSEVTNPQSGCRQDHPLPVVVKITNTGNIGISPGAELTMKYRLEQNGFVSETLQLENNLQPGNSVQYEFEQKVTLDKDKLYTLQALLNLSEDETASNDTIVKGVDIHFPDPQLVGKDTLVLSEEDFPYNLSVGDQYATVLWNNGSTNHSFEINDFGVYWVQVTDNYGCEGSDTLAVVKKEEEGDEEDEDPDAIHQIRTEQYQIQVFPNPVSRYLTLDVLSDRNVSFTVSLVSLDGRVRYVNQFEVDGRFIHKLPVSQFSGGFYQLKVQEKTHIHVIPIIIK